MKRNSTWIRFFLAVSVIAAGGLVYLVQRPAAATHIGRFVSHYFGALPTFHGYLRGFSESFPDFAHPFAFALFTMLIFPEAGRLGRMAICLFWLAMNLFFEMGQYFDEQFAGIVKLVLPDSRLGDILADFFIIGTYDYFDVLAMGLGVIFAFIASELTQTGGVEHENKTSGKQGKVFLETVC